jgi:hypothetical protein
MFNDEARKTFNPTHVYPGVAFFLQNLFIFLSSLVFKVYQTWSQCCRSGMFIPDPGFEFFPSRFQVYFIPDPRSASKNLRILSQKIVF